MYIILGIISYFAIILVSIVTVYSWIDGEKKLAAVNFVLVIVLSILTIVCFAKTQEEKVREEIVKDNLNQGGIKMKPFSLGKYLANPERKIVTREGKRVRIICPDRAGSITKPVVALVTSPNGNENIKTFWANGIETAGCDGKDDLFFAPSKHTDYINLYHNENGYYLGGTVFSSAEKAKEIAAESGYYLTTIKAEWEE